MAATASAGSRRGLDWLNFFVANAQTGFGPFIAVYLTSEAWTLTDIGDVLAIGTVAAMVSQLPGGAAVDALRDKRVAALLAGLGVAVSALMFALWPDWLPVVLSEVLHGFASCMLGPAIAAITVLLVKPLELGERFGRNAQYAALGSAIAAAIFGVFGTYVSERSVFFLTAVMMLAGLLALRAIRLAPAPRVVRDPRRLPGPGPRARMLAGMSTLSGLLSDRRLLVFAACVMLFHLSNAAMLPLVASAVTTSVGDWASMIVAGCIVLPQVVVAVISPWLGRTADRHGRRLVLIAGFAALPVRALLLAMVTDPLVLVGVQALDGLSAAVLGLMLPLVAADLTRGTGHYNLCIGALGLAMGLGATGSTIIAGTLADLLGPAVAFAALGLAGLAALLLVVLAMPETQIALPEGEEGLAVGQD